MGSEKEEIDRPYTGPDKKDRAVIKKMDNKKFAAKQQTMKRIWILRNVRHSKTKQLRV